MGLLEAIEDFCATDGPLCRDLMMKLKGRQAGIADMTNGCMPPRPGEGLYICRKCGAHFHRNENDLKIFFGIGLPFVRCPKCRSFNTQRDWRVVY